MQTCPFCAEEIQDEAIKCKHCGEFLDGRNRDVLDKKKVEWYFGIPFLVFCFLCVGPLALPLLWWRPNTSKAWKVIITILTLILSWLLYEATIESVEMFKEYYQMINELSAG